MEPSAISRRAWTVFSLVGIALWIGVTVLVGALEDDPTDGGGTVLAFVAGGAVFFSLMFATALVQQLRARAEGPEARFGKRLAVGYTLTGTVVTALGLGAISIGSDGDDVSALAYPLIAIVVIWAGVALCALNRYRRL